MSALSSKHRTYPPTLTAEEVRASINDPDTRGNKDQLFAATFGRWSEEKVDELERRINAMNERVDDDERSPS